MTDDVTLSVAELHTIAVRALVRSGAQKTNAEYVAEAICHAETRGIRECGVPHLIDFCAHLQSGRVDGTVPPSRSPSGCRRGPCASKWWFFSTGLRRRVSFGKQQGS